MRLVMWRNVATSAARFPVHIIKLSLACYILLLNIISKLFFFIENLQATFHPDSLGMFGHVDNIFPDTAAGLGQLWSGVFHFRRT